MNAWEALVSIVLIVGVVVMTVGWPWKTGDDE